MDSNRSTGDSRESAGYPSALGNVDDLDPSIRPLFRSGDHFREMPEPEPGDWLAVHDEPGQSFEEFRGGDPHRPEDPRDTIYVQPIGAFESRRSPSLEKLQTLTEAYYQTPTVIRDPLEIASLSVQSRENPHGGQKQLLTTDLLQELRSRRPDDAFAMVGVTMIDLYPEESWNFVFGQAAHRARVGIYSFYRYTRDTSKPPLWRSGKVMVHELGHLFGVGHCIYYECGMNGSNSLSESDERPIHLCPVDLRKLNWSVGFDPVERYRDLLDFYETVGWNDEADWVKGRLELVDTSSTN